MRMRSRTWFLLSLMLFIAAAFFWRLGEERVASRQNAKQKISTVIKKETPATREVSVVPAVSSKKLLIDSATNSAVANSTNAQVPYPHRLQNTSQTIDQLVRNDSAILLRNALIDTSAGSVSIPDEL